jgi:integrase
MTTRFPRIKRTVPGLGVVRLATRATSKRQHQRRVVLFDELLEADQGETIRALLDGSVTWSELAEHRREKGRFGAGVLTDVRGRRVLREAVPPVLATMGGTVATRKRYAVTWKRLDALLGEGVTVADLAGVDYKALRAQWGKSASDWNHVGRFLSAFLSAYVGKHHPLRHQVVAAFPRRAESPRVPDLSPALFWQIVDAAPAHVRASYVTLALTGMRVRTEYLALTPAHLMPHTHRVRVPGTKTEASAAVVSVDPAMWHWVAQGVPSRVRYKWLRLHWVRACAKVGASGVTLHSLRHALAQWSSDAGLGLADVQAALRHTNLSTTEGYARRSGTARVAGAIGTILTRKKA